MKILSAQQIKEADKYTMQHEPVASIDLMERAAGVFTDWFVERFPHKRQVVKFFCGTGNNGGDGLAIARMLHARGYHTEVFIVRYSPTPSKDFLINEQRLKKLPVPIADIHSGNNFPVIQAGEIVIDGMWGSGLNRPIEGFAADLITHLNNSPGIKIAIDIPSGLFADLPSDSVKFKADYTLTFELPKLSFFFPQNFPYVGEFVVKSIGLHPAFLSKAETSHYYITEDMVREMIVPRKKFDHKGTFGHALIISGSYGKMGAAVLCSEACLRAGAGLVTACIPRCGYSVIQSALPEAMVITDRQEEIITEVPTLAPYKAIGIGPGIGTHARTSSALHQLIAAAEIPLVADADALNILSDNKVWLNELPQNSILTPHPKEFERIFGTSPNDYSRLELQKEASRLYRIILMLKRAHTVITTPEGNAYFNSTGNPGMATGGSGDVLTGIITGLLSQGYSPLHSAVLGVFLHGRAGDIASRVLSQPSMLASDITHHLGSAFKEILS
ncbi:MAG TPA: NAD(P)H-hydrate dehydratase [Chitinophagales bacterium]|nr:NAD(P)H-hydrate dehydratase [Chitinophagales bacterium]